MTRQTWGIHIPGYSYPSERQKALFERLYPGVAARHQDEIKRLRAEQDRHQRAVVQAERAFRRDQQCDHLWVPSGFSDCLYCKHCQLHIAREDVLDDAMLKSDLENKA